MICRKLSFLNDIYVPSGKYHHDITIYANSLGSKANCNENIRRKNNRFSTNPTYPFYSAIPEVFIVIQKKVRNKNIFTP